MKVLILSVHTGQGHNQVAASIMNRLNEEEDVTCNTVDVFSYVSPILGKSISEGYLLATKYAPSYYGSFYRLAERISGDSGFNYYSIVDKLLSRKLNQLLNEQEPDIILCTHVFAASLLRRFSTQLSDTIKAGIVTDYTLHPFWEQTKLDYIIVPSKSVMEEAINRGIPQSKLLPFGMPIHEKFLSKLDKNNARYTLGIDNKNTILVMGGSMGFGSIDEVIAKLDSIEQDFQILCICGTNDEMKEKIQNMLTRKTVYTYGYVDNVEVFMDASDCIITKPGGITVSECLVKNLPMILTNPIPGQEDRNVDFLNSKKAAMVINEELSLENAVNTFFANHALKDKMIENIKEIAKPMAVEDICSFVKEHIQGSLVETY